MPVSFVLRNIARWDGHFPIRLPQAAHLQPRINLIPTLQFHLGPLGPPTFLCLVLTRSILALLILYMLLKKLSITERIKLNKIQFFKI